MVNNINLITMIVALLCLIINGIAITVGISHAYASVPVTFALVFYVLAVNYECKNILALGEANRPDTYFSIGFGGFSSFHYSVMGWVLHASEV